MMVLTEEASLSGNREGPRETVLRGVAPDLKEGTVKTCPWGI